MAAPDAASSGTAAGDEKEILLSEVPTRVQKVNVEGLQRTKDDVVKKHVEKVFSAKNFEEMVLRTQQARTALQKLGLFKRVRIGIDIARGPDAKPDGYDVTFDVKESRRVTGGVSTMVGTNDGSVLFSVTLPNVFGRGEKINTEYTYGTKNALGYGFGFSKPLQGNPDVLFQTTAFQNSGEFPWSGYREIDRGVATELMFPTYIGSHHLRWEGVWRELSCLSRTTAFAVREQCGHTVKSSLKHVIVRDTRDNRVLPNIGYKLQLSEELAGLGGDTRFMKGEVEFQHNIPLPLGSVLQVCLAGGMMKPLTPGEDVKINDRLFLGGPLTFRGYNLKGIGPHEDSCALGASTYWCGGLHLYTPLPFRPGRGGFGDLFRLHGFVTAGNLGNLEFKTDLKDNLRSLAEGYRWSYGAGIVLRMGGMARLEVNYCWPMRAQARDSVCPGFQFGIGINFL